MEGDSHYRGPFGALSLKMIALIAMTVSQLSMIALQVYKGMCLLHVEEEFFTAGQHDLLLGLSSVGVITFPLLLIANMSLVFTKRKEIYKVILSNFVLAALTYWLIITQLSGILVSLASTMVDTLVSAPDLVSSRENMIYELAKYFTRGNGVTLIEEYMNGTAGDTLKMVLAGFSDIAGEAERFNEALLSQDGVRELLNSIDPQQLADFFIYELPALLEENGLDLNELLSIGLNELLPSAFLSYMNINVFQDLLLCNVCFYFVAYRSERLQGGRLVLFRTLSILPIAWLVVGVVLSGMIRAGMLVLPVWLVALLPSKRLSGLVLFFCMVLYYKYHEAEYIRQGKTEDEYEIYLSSNKNSTRFSVFMAVVLILISVAEWSLSHISGIANWRIGTSSGMYLAVPFVLLFSYNRVQRHKVLNVFVPAYYTIHYIVLYVVILLLIAMLPDMIIYLLSNGLI